ncbi:MAG TPA: NAD-dependent epimerase/dehydratase family protein [Anaerolineae bacterium]|nr:NAD-dependent epimerase/dehydratase family protein [Anaerolineae bacterium]
MNILVTGGAGFIGSHVVDAFVAAGHQVSIVDDLSSGKREYVNPEARFYQADIRQEEIVREIIESDRVEVICHQAALVSVRESMVEPLRYASVNILGSLTLLELARKYECRRFIYASTGGAVYGEPEVLPASEDTPINPLDCYGASKHTVEHYLYLYEKNYGLPYTALRYANVYGPRQDPMGEAGVVAIFSGQMLAGKPVTINGSGKQVRDFVYVEDVARANVLALSQTGSGIYNIGTGIPTDINILFAKMKAAADYPLEPNYGPPKLGEVFRIYLDNRRAREALGWEPRVDLEEGIRRTLAYFKHR